MLPVSIRSSTIRLGIFISSLVIAVILVFQLIWLNNVYKYEEKQFDHSIVKALRGLYEDLDVKDYYTTHLSELIEKPSPNLYIARIALPVNMDSLSSYLRYELEDFNIFTDCQLGIYSAAERGFIDTLHLPATVANNHTVDSLPASSRLFDHLSLYFPNRRQYILTQMNVWIISSAVLLLVLILFGGSLYYFYRQKFLNETQKDFIHNFTHEFKTPVSVISLAADVLKNPAIVDKPEKLATYAGIVEYQSAYLQKQIEKLLKFAYTDSRSLHISKETVDLHELLKEAVNYLEPLIREKKAIIQFDLQASNAQLAADRDYLVIVIVNLLDNAIKYSREPKINIQTANGIGSIRLVVKDNGIGIEKKFLKKIFLKFFRAGKGETYQAKGFGLGLSFVQKIIDAHKGKINVQSEPGKGSEFSIELPI